MKLCRNLWENTNLKSDSSDQTFFSSLHEGKKPILSNKPLYKVHEFLRYGCKEVLEQIFLM